jgi:hypothetical protein
LEEKLANSASDDLPRLLAESMPEELTIHQTSVKLVASLLADGAAVELLIDGYDEITDERPQVGRCLSRIFGLLAQASSRLVMTTRPSSVPQQKVASLMATLELQPFSEREQLRFVDTWFHGRPDRAAMVKQWVLTRRLDLLSTPLLIALLCAATSRPDDVPPESEPELMHRVLTRLASQQERFDQVDILSTIVQRRVDVLEQIALSYIAPDRILESVSGTVIEGEHQNKNSWRDLKSFTSKGSVLDDLAATGLVQKIQRGHDVEVKFLHSAIRDYLIARIIGREGSWREYLWRIWSQPEWEPAIAYVAALLPKPDDLLLALERKFDTDPLNSARFVAGRAVALSGARISPERRRRTRDELLLLLGSNDPIDRSRSAVLLASLQDDQTAAMVRSLINPCVPTRVVEAALRSVAGGDSAASLAVIASCARDNRFTIGERETAVEALAELGSNEALLELEHVALDTEVVGNIRAAAAFAALRRLNAPDAARMLLTTDDGNSQDARWGLAERIGAQAQSLSDFMNELQESRGSIPDLYCRALITAIDPERASDRRMLASAIPGNVVLDILVTAVETARAAAESDPLAVVGARFILDGSQSDFLRSAMAQRIVASSVSPLEVWREFIRELPMRGVVLVAEFLRDEVQLLPSEIGSLLRAAIEDGQFGAVAKEVLGRQPDEPNDDLDHVAPQEVAVEPSSGQESGLDAILADPTQGGLMHYQLLRGLHRTLPKSGQLADAAASLTHAVAGVGAVAWIDAQPSVAGALEERLALSVHREAGYELAKLRTAWPTRQGEVEFTVESYNANVLNSRALAALLEENPVEAATMALASIGAHEADNKLPTELVTRILFAAGTLTRRGSESYAQVSNYRRRFQESGQSPTLLHAWLQVAAGSTNEVAKLMNNFIPRSFESEAEYISLLYVSGSASVVDFGDAHSWAGCRTAHAFLTAVAQFHSPGVLRERIEQARDEAARRAGILANRWPHVTLRSPNRQGRPPWQRKLVEIAAGLLQRGLDTAAAAMFEAALKELPDSADLINNHGFSIVPSNPDVALKELDRAASLYPRPFAVNVANRMLLRFHRGDYRDVLAIAESYRDLGVSEESAGSWWLWDIDDLTILSDIENIYAYLTELARRAARALGRYDIADQWSAWEMEMTGSLDAATSSDELPNGGDTSE